MPIAQDKGFNAKIFECIDRGLGLLGAGVKESFYYRIEKEYHLPAEEFSTRPREMIDHLEAILGTTGSSFVEKLIVREIRNEFKLESRPGSNLMATIGEARAKFLSS